MKTPYDVIIKPVISERSMDIAPDKKYTFKVAVDANKTEVKKVNVMNMDGKLKRMGRTEGRRAAYKKAIVTLTADSKEIEFFQSL